MLTATSIPSRAELFVSLALAVMMLVTIISNQLPRYIHCEPALVIVEETAI